MSLIFTGEEDGKKRRTERMSVYDSDRPNTIVQEDKAPAHAHHMQKEIYSIFDILQMLWPGNSPDLNAIEPTWAFMKRATTRYGPPRTRPDASRSWLTGWRNLEQSRIQCWIERIPHHIQEIICLEGGNEYCETQRAQGGNTGGTG